MKEKYILKFEANDKVESHEIYLSFLGLPRLLGKLSSRREVFLGDCEYAGAFFLPEDERILSEIRRISFIILFKALLMINRQVFILANNYTEKYNDEMFLFWKRNVLEKNGRFISVWNGERYYYEETLNFPLLGEDDVLDLDKIKFDEEDQYFFNNNLKYLLRDEFYNVSVDDDVLELQEKIFIEHGLSELYANEIARRYIIISAYRLYLDNLIKKDDFIYNYYLRQIQQYLPDEFYLQKYCMNGINQIEYTVDEINFLGKYMDHYADMNETGKVEHPDILFVDDKLKRLRDGFIIKRKIGKEERSFVFPGLTEIFGGGIRKKDRDTGGKILKRDDKSLEQMKIMAHED